MGGRRIFGHGVGCPSAVHVRSRSPVSPWTKQTSIVAFGHSCHTLTPSGKEASCTEMGERFVSAGLVIVGRGPDEESSLVPCGWIVDTSESGRDCRPATLSLNRSIGNKIDGAFWRTLNEVASSSVREGGCSRARLSVAWLPHFSFRRATCARHNSSRGGKKQGLTPLTRHNIRLLL